METDRSKYAINPSFFSNEKLVDYIRQKEQDLVRIQTQLEMAWEELYNRGEADHKWVPTSTTPCG